MCLPEGPARPSRVALDAFWAQARAARPQAGLADHYQVRWIGLDAPSAHQIFDLIRAGDKTGTFTLPWIVERTGQPIPSPCTPSTGARCFSHLGCTSAMTCRSGLSDSR